MDSPDQLKAGDLQDTHGYSAAVRSVLAFTAFVVTLLPIPLIYFEILPAYDRHAWFLFFYTPFLCLLTLCYLFYLRDSLARVAFANVLDPPAPPDSYYQEPVGERVQRGFRQVKGVLLGILPPLLVIASMYCLSRYFVAFEGSVRVAAEAYQERASASESARAAPGQSGSVGKRRAARAGGVGERAPGRDTAADSLPQPSDTLAVRQYVLRTAAIDNIPRLVELTLLFVGAFVALLIAVTLMALKEYAKEALGLSEHELMFGRYRRSVTEE
jgi:hypothetical protein